MENSGAISIFDAPTYGGDLLDFMKKYGKL
jgi:hypothetical protein